VRGAAERSTRSRIQTSVKEVFASTARAVD
jgi:hypothetical protein